ncbi:ZIP family metal transporter [Kordiimonas marina]|uniref:ZIP family metal transporter n=1 Tax=Kordiimonas marina TaxID=2872312 RepID=UPI001FF626A6|nr:ZIP family metal transporter [Kordiimonas marina]MCJ9428214.1 ZIP family metal transporter [Kordiimonas marina]
MPALKGGLDGFVLMTVLGLITLTLLPEALEHAGLLGLMIAILGFSLPWIAEFVFHKPEQSTHRIVMLVAALALVVHATSDGAILALAKNSPQGDFVAGGVLLHRIGVAIAVWWLLRPVLTTTGGIAVLAALGAMTVIGYLMAIFASDWWGVPLIGYWQAFAAGSLLHVILHPLEHHSTAPKPETMRAHRVGTALGILFVTALIYAHYLYHVAGPLDTTLVHGAYHAVDTIAAVGRFIAPGLLLILVAGGILLQLYKQPHDTGVRTLVVGGYHGLQKIAPWTVALWIAAAFVVELLPFDVKLPSGGYVLFSLWLACVCAILIHTGARKFFSVLLPTVHIHHHGHSHSH